MAVDISAELFDALCDVIEDTRGMPHSTNFNDLETRGV